MEPAGRFQTAAALAHALAHPRADPAPGAIRTDLRGAGVRNAELRGRGGRRRADVRDEVRRALDRAIGRAVPLRRSRAVSAQRRLAALSPLAVLGRGYAIIEGADGHVRASVAALASGDRVRLRMRDGRAGAIVEKVTPNG